MHRIFFWSLTSALAGFLFGFDTVVISGAEKTIQALWGLSPGLHGIAMASALYGTVVGSLLGGWPTDRFGRKATLLWIGVLYFVGAVGSALAPNVCHVHRCARSSAGWASASPRLRRRCTSRRSRRRKIADAWPACSNSTSSSASWSLSSQMRCWPGIGENAWRWMLGVAAFPSLLYAVLCFGLPESPRWLLSRKGDRAAGLSVCSCIEPEALAGRDRSRGGRDHGRIVEQERPLRTSGRGGCAMPILLAILIAFFNQLSGINAILYFAPRIFELTGLGAKAALLQSVGIGDHQPHLHLCGPVAD